MTDKAKITLYAAGGCGINIASYFEQYRDKPMVDRATVQPVYIDTSRSNISRQLPEDSVYAIEGLDGSGKVRAENHVRIGECVLDILQKHRPGDLNIVLSSASGGSGSVIAPSLVSELLNRDLPTVVIIIGSTDSRIEVENTIRTFKSYEGIAQLRRTPVVAFYHENSEATARRVVDADVHRAIVVMTSLFSGNNRELDSSDLRNWLKYTKVTSYEAHLTNIDFFIGKINLVKPNTAISVATLGEDGVDTSTGITVEYQCVGYVPQTTIDKLDFKLPMHAVVLSSVFNEVHKRLDKTLQHLDEAKQARINRSTILSDKDRPTNTGLVL